MAVAAEAMEKQPATDPMSGTSSIFESKTQRATEPWSVVLIGSKTEIEKQLGQSHIPTQVQEAIRLLLASHAEVPGYTDEDPALVWEREVPHTARDIPPKKRAELFTSVWKVSTNGHPAAHGSTNVVIETMRSPK